MPRQGRETAALRDFKPAYVADGSKPVGLRLRTTIPLHPGKQTYRLQQPARSRKHRPTSLGELHVGPALVQPEPAVGDGAIEAGGENKRAIAFDSTAGIFEAVLRIVGAAFEPVRERGRPRR